MTPRTALLLIDFINDLDFAAGARVAPRVLRAARNTVALRDSRRAARAPVVYVNDNFGHWDCDLTGIAEYCRQTSERARRLVDEIAPRQGDYQILKPRHSAFYSTPLALLLEKLEVRRLILTGVAVDICVQFTANDAYLRSYELWIPANCVAGESAAIERASLNYFKRVLKADIRST